MHMEVSAIKHMGAAGAHGRSPLLRLQSDERLVTLVRRGNQHAFEALVSRYQSRLLAFCRHMLSSREDAEDVLQEVFTAAFNAMVADERPINVRPWLYRIARNRSLNHLRRVQAIGVDSMDTHFSEGGISTAEKVHRREDFRLLVSDVQELPETQKTALLLREIDALSYEQIAEAMDNTVPSVKSLLVRARVGLAEAAEARLLDCDLVRLDLGEVAEGLKRMSPPVRRHLRTCDECASFRKQLANTNRALAALMPVGPLLLLKKMLVAHVGTTAAASGGSAAAGSTFGGALQLGINATAGKAAAGLAAAAIVTAGAVEVKHVTVEQVGNAPVVATSAEPVATAGPSPSPAVADPAAITPPPAPSAHSDPLESRNSVVDDRASKPVDDAAAPRREDDENAITGAPEVTIEPAATGDAAPSPVMTTGLLPATAGGQATLLGIPVPGASPPAMHTEVIVRPGQVAMGAPTVGVVVPGTPGPGPVGAFGDVLPLPASSGPAMSPALVTSEPRAEPAGTVQPVVEPTPERDPIPEPEAVPSPTPAPEPLTPPAPVAPARPAAELPEPAPAPQPAPELEPAAQPELVESVVAEDQPAAAEPPPPGA